MTLIVIVASLLLEHVFGHWQRLRRLSWLSSLRKHLLRIVTEPWQSSYQGVLVLLLIPCIVIWLTQLLLQGYAWFFLELIFSILVVSYCLGPEPFNERVEEYIAACEGHHRLDAKQMAEALVGDEVSDNQWQQSCSVTKAILYEGNIRIFAVLFWFLLLGPVGAVLYRCSAFLAQGKSIPENESIQSAAERIFFVLDWLPANLLSLTFFLTGSFDDAWQAWIKAVKAELELTERNRSIVTHTGCGAIRHEVDDVSDQEKQEDGYDLNWVRAARSLVLRSLVVWLVAVAILTMYGRFV